MDRRTFLKTAALLTSAASPFPLSKLALAARYEGAAPAHLKLMSSADGSEAELLAEGKATVDTYLRARNMIIAEDTGDYSAFLLSVLNDHHPDLVSKGDIDIVTLYAIRKLQLQPDTQTPTAQWERSVAPMSGGSSVAGDTEALAMAIPAASQLALWANYDRWAARNYTYQWTAWWGGKSRNPNYPNFSSDCTNFISQAVYAGRVAMAGGGICGSESNANEWYVSKGISPCSWRWSHSWSVVLNFRQYMRDKVGAYVEAYASNRESVSLLISRAREGDIIQFDDRPSTAYAWTPRHTAMVSTKKNNGGYYSNDLTYNDHSGGPNLNDSRDASLRAKYQNWGNTSLKRMVWIRMW